jgi:hypothetical protein
MKQETPPKCVDVVITTLCVTGFLFGVFSPVAFAVGCFVGPHIILGAIAYLGIAIALYFIQRGLRRRKLWARYGAILLGMVVILLMGVVSWQMLIAREEPIAFLFPVAVGSVFVYSVVALMRPSAEKWFSRK